MQSHYEIPDTFWSLFRSVNREIYIESLLSKENILDMI